MRLTGSRAYYRQPPPKMPAGLVELMEDLTREVLKSNPTDIHGFCAGHMQRLLEIRDGPLQKKVLTLDEKIAKAQEKVRQRSEKRRQRYDTELLIIQQNKTTLDAISAPSLSPQELKVANTLRTPIHHDQELVNSSELEVSHAPNIGIHKLSEDAQLKENEVSVEALDAVKYDTPTEAMQMEHASKNDTNMREIHNVVSKETELSEGNKKAINHLSEAAEGQTTYNEENSFKESGLCKSEINGFHESNKASIDDTINSLTVNEGKINIMNSAEILKTATEIDTDNSSVNTSAKSDDQNSPTQTNIVIKNDMDEIQANDRRIDENIEECNDIESVVLPIYNETIPNENAEDTKESNSIEISYKEPPAVELQDSLLISDMLESLPATDTDSDISTLITQDSTNDKLLQNNASTTYSSNSIDSVTSGEGDKQNDESNMETSDESRQNTTQHLNKTIDSSNAVVNQNDMNANLDNHSEHVTSTKLMNDPQINSQNSSNMDLETAAITIQKVFRNFLFKSRTSTFDDTVTDETNVLDEDDKNKEECDFQNAGALHVERRPHGLTRMDTVLQTVNEEKSLSLSTDDSSTLSSAATVIQAHIRGFLVRNKINSNKTISTNSLAASNSNEPSLTSLEMDNDQYKNKTVLNIRIVPEGGNYLSRDESVLTSMDLSLDSSPPSSINLHPLGYDKTERRKQLKREDAIQSSISPPSNNSGKLSEDVDSVKDLPLNDNVLAEHQEHDDSINDDLQSHESTSAEIVKIDNDENIELKIVKNLEELPANTINNDLETYSIQRRGSLSNMNSDEMDVVTPFPSEETNSSTDTKLMHSGEFHDAVLPTKVSRSDTTIASEFKNVLVYFLLWNNS